MRPGESGNPDHEPTRPRAMKTRFGAALCIGMLLAGCGEEPAPGPERQAATSDLSKLEYACGGRTTFTPEDIDRETPASPEILEAIDKLRQTMDGAYLPEEGWFAVSESADRVEVLAPLKDQYVSASFEMTGDVWKPTGWGDCLPRLQLQGKSVLRWAFDDDSFPPDPNASKLRLMVSEAQCSSGRDIEGLIEPAVNYEDTRIEVTLTAPPASGTQTCPGRAPTPYELTLDEPVGDREVVDPSVYPVVEPAPSTRLP